MSNPRLAAVIVLAAGEGTRMKSATPKVLHRIAGRTLVGHAIAAAREAQPEHLAVVVRHERDLVATHVAEVDPKAVIADQDDVKGTGRAVQCALDVLPADLDGTVLVTYGDVPLLSGSTLHALVDHHSASGSAVTVITANLANPTGYGRILRGADDSRGGDRRAQGRHAGAARDHGDQLRHLRLRRRRCCATPSSTSRPTTPRARSTSPTSSPSPARRVGACAAHLIDDLWQTEGVNDRVQLARLGKELNRRITEKWMREGVTIVDPDTTWIDADVAIGRDATILPGTQLLGATTIGADAVIGPDTTLEDTEVGERATISRTESRLAVVGADATVGPFSYLRPGTELGAKGKIGGFVETKNAKIGEGAKVPHLTYCGDATIGEGANIGAGTIFANYDGVAKHHTTVGAHSFVGSDSVLIAPVNIADGAYVGAGSAVTADVGPGQIAVARGQQRNIAGWVARRRAGTKTAEAAEAAARHTPDAREADQP